MAAYTIRPIALCEGARDSSHFAYRASPGTICNTACYVWLIETQETQGPRILVDAGAQAANFTKRGTPEKDLISLEAGLANLNLVPGDVDVVIVTHLHCDHIELGYLYKKARFIVQKRELEYALNPHPIDADLYEKSTFEGLNWEVIDGAKEIIPGISVFLTPGHSPGGQSVEVTTLSGKAVITGFCCTLDTFIQTPGMKRRGWEVTAPLIHNDVRVAYDSVLEVKHKADIILALHDPIYIKEEKIP